MRTKAATKLVRAVAINLKLPPSSAAMPSQSSATPPHIVTKLLSGASQPDLNQAATLLRNAHLVAFPTETVYGLGGLATSTEAISSIYAAKSRPPDNPLIVHLASTAALQRHPLTPLPLSSVAQKLTDAFWPGPLTLILPLHPDSQLSPLVTAGLPTVAIRVPKHPIASQVLARAAVPVAAPSANRSGRPSPTAAAHVLTDLNGRISAVVDANEPLLHGVESTVVDLSDPSAPCVLRPGAISEADLQKVAGVPFVTPVMNVERPRAPGMKYRHYAPRAPLHIVERDQLVDKIAEYEGQGVVGVLGDDHACSLMSGPNVVPVLCGSRGDAASYARRLYGALRVFDGETDGQPSDAVNGVCVILAVPPDRVDDGVWEAVMNRLVKAADKGYSIGGLTKEG